MATGTVDSHQTSTSDEQNVKLSSEAVKATDPINHSAEKESVEHDKPTILSTSEEIQAAVDIPIPVKMETESIPDSLTTTVENPSTQPHGNEATEPPAVPAAASAEKLIPPKVLDAAKLEDEEEQPTVVKPVEKVDEKKPKIVDSPEFPVDPTTDSGECCPAKEQPEKSCVTESSVEPPNKETQPIEVLPVKEVIETVEPSMEKEQASETHPVQETGEVTVKKISESVEVPQENELQVEVQPVKEIEVTAKKPSESIEPPENKEQPGEVFPMKESEVVAKEISESFEEPPENKEQSDEVVPVPESGEAKAKETSASALDSKEVEKKEQANEFVSVEQEQKEQPEASCVTEPSVESPEKEKQTIAVPVKEPVEIIEKEIINMVEPPKENMQASEVHPVQESIEVIAKKISESLEFPKENALQVEVHSVKEELKVTEKETTESIEPPKKKEQPEEDLRMKESGEVISDSSNQMARRQDEALGSTGVEKQEPVTQIVSVEKEQKDQPETSCDPEPSVEPPEKEKQPVEVVPVKKPVEIIEKEIIETVKPPKEKEQASEVHPGQESSDATTKKISEFVELPRENELPAEVHPVEELEVLPMKDAEVVAREISESFEPLKSKEQPGEVSPMTESEEVKGKETSGLTSAPKEDEFVSIEKELKEKPDTASVPELSVGTSKIEGQPLEVLPVKEPVEVMAKEISEPISLPKEEEQATDVHLIQESREVIVADCAPELSVEISEPKELPEEKEKATEVHPMQGSEEVMAEKVNESVECPKENEIPIEVHPEQHSTEVTANETIESIETPQKEKKLDEVLAGKESDTAKDVTASFVPPKSKDQPDEVFSKTESGDVKEKETSGSTLDSKEVEKPESEDKKVEDGRGEVPDTTNQIQNNYVEVEPDATVKCETVKDEKSLALGDDINPPLGGQQIHKEKEQCMVESNKQDSFGQVAQPDVKLAARDISPRYVEEKASQENENKVSSNTDSVQKLSEVEEMGVEKVGEENEQKSVKTDKEDEDKYERIQESTLPTEENAAKGSEAPTEVAKKSIDDNKTGEELVAETKIEESVKDEKPALVESGNADHIDEKRDFNETPKELQESEVEVKDKETMITGTEIPEANKEPSKKEDDEIKLSENLQKEVPSKPTQKHSHNILSKVKQSLVKAKKAIIGKSPGSKTLSSEAKDDIKVK